MDDTGVALTRISESHESSSGWPTLTLQQGKLFTVSKSNLTSSLYSACRVRLYKQTPETGLGAEVYHQASLVIDTHAGWVKRTWRKIWQKKDIFTHWISSLLGSFRLPETKVKKGAAVTWNSRAAYPGARPVAGCRCRPSTEWLCRTQTWAAALTAGQSAASRPFPQGSGTRMTRREEHAASRRTAPGWAPAWKKTRVDFRLTGHNKYWEDVTHECVFLLHKVLELFHSYSFLSKMQESLFFWVFCVVHKSWQQEECARSLSLF